MTRIALAAALFASISAPAMAAPLIANGGFETPAVPAGTFTQVGNGGSIGAWTVNGNDVLAIHTDYNEDSVDFTAQAGSVAVDLTGAGNTGANSISQTVNLGAAATRYVLSFYIGNVGGGTQGNQGVYGGPASFDVFAGNTFLGNFSNNAGGPGEINWLRQTASFTGSGLTDIRFVNTNPAGDNYTGLDSVGLGVPEPATWAMMIMGFGLIGAALRRRNVPVLATA